MGTWVLGQKRTSRLDRSIVGPVNVEDREDRVAVSLLDGEVDWDGVETLSVGT